MSSSNYRKIEKDAEEIYKKYAPFQCLAYWYFYNLNFYGCLDLNYALTI